MSLSLGVDGLCSKPGSGIGLMPVFDEWPVDRFTSLLLFTRIVETGSLSAAARDAKLSQPTVSKQLAELEARLGAQLLQRTTRQLSLTEVGSAFYIRAKRILTEWDEAEADATDLHGSPRGTLRVGAPVAFGRLHVMPTLPAFLRRHPGAGRGPSDERPVHRPWCKTARMSLSE